MFSNTSSGHFSAGTNEANNNCPRAIIPNDPHHHHHHHHHHHSNDSGVTHISGARPNQKRQPHGGAKSHKILDKASFQNLFVARLPRALTSNDAFLEVFSHYSPVSATIMMNMETGQSKGFGFVTFETEAEGQLAFENLNNRKLRVSIATTEEGETPSFVFFTPEIKPSTFNGHRIVVESPHVYIRNIPIALLFASNEGEGQTPSFTHLIDFFSTFGEVQLIEFHGGQRLSDVASGRKGDNNTTTAPPLLVSFATKEQAAAAIATCHGKVHFPELYGGGGQNTVALMAKYADMTTVKSIQRHTTGGATPHHRQERKGSGSSSSFGGSTTTAGGEASSSPSYPFPTGPAAALGTTTTSHTTVPTSGSSIMPVHKNYSDSSLPSPAGSVIRASVGQRRPSPPTEFWTPLLSMPPQQPYQYQQQYSSSVSSGGAGSRRGSNSLAGSSSYHSQQLQTSSSLPLYRNDPYNQSGYVMVTSSSSSSSKSSSFVLGNDQQE